jgi:hypothetical protein
LPTLADLLASIRGATDQDVSGPITDDLLVLWLNEEQGKVRRRIAAFAPALFEAISGDFVVTSPATTIDISSLTTLLKILEVQQKRGADYFSIRPAGLNATIGPLAYRQRGFPGAGCVIDLFPARMAPGTYRVRYTTAATPFVLANPTTQVVQLPAGGETALVEAVAARVRVRCAEDPSGHLQLEANAYAELRMGLEPHGGAIIDSTGRY